MLDLSSIVSQVRRGMVPAHVYDDPEIFALERDRLFTRSWVFLAHESEIPEPGDYVVRRVLADSFIVARDEAGVIRVMFNMCLHRGMQVCRAEMGNASHFRCPYHAWTYRNDGRLAGLPFHEDAYGGEDGFARSGQSLLPAPSMATYNGLIFISLRSRCPRAARLARRLRVLPGLLHPPEPGRRGVARPAALAGQGQLEDRRGELRRRQLPHAAHPRERGGDRPVPRAEGQQAQGGRPLPGRPRRGDHLQARRPAAASRISCGYVGYPDAMIPGMAATWSDRQRALVADSGFMVSAATLFPNLSFVHNWPQIDAAGTVAPFISLRQWQPVSERETEVLSWFAVDAAAPEDFKRRSYKAYLMCFGISGMFEQDDVENWVSITDMATGSMARRLKLNSRMGLTSEGKPLKPPLAAFAGPGVAYQGFGEYDQRHWLSQWSDHLARGAR